MSARRQEVPIFTLYFEILSKVGIWLEKNFYLIAGSEECFLVWENDGLTLMNLCMYAACSKAP